MVEIVLEETNCQAVQSNRAAEIIENATLIRDSIRERDSCTRCYSYDVKKHDANANDEDDDANNGKDVFLCETCSINHTNNSKY